jgi:hypothetical protein
MRNGFLATLTVLLAGAPPALAQMPYSYGGYPGYPVAYPAYPAPYGGNYGYYNYMPQPPRPPVIQPPMPPMPYAAPGYGYPTAAQGPQVLGWPPPAQQLPSANPPPPQMVPQASDPASCAPLTDPVPGSPLACEVPAAPPPPPEKETATPTGYRWYGGIEGLFLWLKHDNVPPLVATGPLGTGTTVLLDSTEFDDWQRWAGRGTVGYWLDSGQALGVEISWLQIANRTPNTSITGPSLAVPFFNLGTGAEDALTLAAPGTQTGSVGVEESTRLWSAELNARGQILRGSCYHVDMLIGFRAIGFDEDLDQTDTTTMLTRRAAGTTTTIHDHFGTRNLFLSGQTGFEGEVHAGRWFADVSAKVAVGDMREEVNIRGDTVTTTPSGTSAMAGGLFAQPGSLGTFSRHQVTVVQELGIELGYQLSHHCRIFGGYELLWFASVVRPGEQIDRGINPAIGMTGTSLAFLFRDNSMWVQGVNCGLEFRY